MRGITGIGTALVLLFASRAAVRADEPKPPPTADEAAAEVAKAWKEKDTARVATLAGRDTPDPWLVADVLLLLGERDAAAAFATAAPRKDVEKLPDFVTTWRNAEADKAVREALVKLNAANTAGRPADALAAAETPAEGAMPYLRLRLAYGRGMVLGHFNKHVESADLLRATAKEAQGLGWLARAASALWEGVRSERRAKRAPQALETAERLLALETERGARTGIGNAHVAVGSVHADADRWDEADAAFKRALEAFRQIGDKTRQVSVLNSLAWAGYRRRNVKDLEDWANESLKISEPAGMWADAARSNEILATGLQDVGRVGAAAKRYRAALEAAGKAKDAAGTARLLLLLGRSLGDAGAHADALEPLQRAAAASEALKPARPADVLAARARRAWSLAALGRLDEAKAEVERAVALAQATKEPWAQGVTLRAQARLLRAEGKRPEAVKAYEEAQRRLAEAREGTQARLTLLELAEIHREAKELAPARTAAETALDGATKTTDQLVLFRAQALLARIRHDQGETQAALDLAREARKGLQELEDARGVGEMDALIPTLEAALTPK